MIGPCIISFLLGAVNIIPQPYSVKETEGSYQLKDRIVIAVDKDFGQPAQGQVADFALCLEQISGLDVKQRKACGGDIVFVLDSSLASQSYVMDITSDGVKIKAGDAYGAIYGLQSLRQLLPSEIYGKRPAEDAQWTLPCCHIEDHPQFAYRGMHLDCARHIFSIEEIHKYLDIMAVFKMNRFHWHLTEDQGWRIEIDRYPQLTKVAAWRDGTQIGADRNTCDQVRYGGFYTKEEIRDVVAYAASLGIEVIPELDLPGHMVAALAAYPDLGCTGGPYRVWTKWGISPDVLCAGNPDTYKFLEGVVDEMVELFPYEYFHIGGDECPKDSWKACPKCQAKIAELGLKADEHASAEARLQNYVMAYMQAYLQTKGKKVIGWDEILEGDLSEGTTIMSWRGAKGGIKAANRGFDVIMTPNEYMYFDYTQLPEKPKGFVGPRRMLPIDKVYSLDPYDQIQADKRQHIIGVQSNVWTEYIADNMTLEFQMLPRMLATSEVQWCPAENKDFGRFKSLVETKWFPTLDLMGYNYYDWTR